MLGLGQPSGDVTLSLQAFLQRWSERRDSPPPAPWQTDLLRIWRDAPQHPPDAGGEPVLDVLLNAQRLPDGSSLARTISSALLVTARRPGEAGAEVKPALRACWAALAAAAQTLRLNPGGWAREAESTFDGMLLTLQKMLQVLKGEGDPVRVLGQASACWGDALLLWETTAAACACDVLPYRSACFWGSLVECIDEAGGAPAALARARGALEEWLSLWALDFAYALAPYLADSECDQLWAGLESFAVELLGWQKLLPGWSGRVERAWNELSAYLPEHRPDETPGSGYRWWNARSLPGAGDLAGGPWQRWLDSGADLPSPRLDTLLRRARLLVALARPAFRAADTPLPTAEFCGDPATWREPCQEVRRSQVMRLLSSLENPTDP